MALCILIPSVFAGVTEKTGVRRKIGSALSLLSFQQQLLPVC